MTRLDAMRLQRALGELMTRIERDGRIHAEVQRARREFFGERAAPRGDAAAELLAEQRFQEWYLLERESELLGAVPAATVELEGDAERLLGSLASVFAITAAYARRVEARDLQGDATVELAVPADTFVAGDLVVGRVYPRDDGAFVPSAAVALYRPGPPLAAAFARDLEQLDLDRRLTQQELERLLLQRPGLRQTGPSRSPAGAAGA